MKISIALRLGAVVPRKIIIITPVLRKARILPSKDEDGENEAVKRNQTTRDEFLTEASALQIAHRGKFWRTRIIIGCPLSPRGTGQMKFKHRKI